MPFDHNDLPEQAGVIAKVADGVVVGSALVEVIAQHGAGADIGLGAERHLIILEQN